MAIHTLSNPKIWIAEFDVTSDMHALALSDGVELVQVNNFACTSQKRIAGLTSPMLQLEGWWQAGTGLIDETLFDNRATGSVPVSVCGVQSAAEGSTAYTFRSIQGSYQIVGGGVGEAPGFSIELEGSDSEGLVRGTLMHNGSETATDTGTAYQVGEIAAGQTLYAALHVTSVSGTLPTLDVVLQSDDAEGFTSATGRITFAQATDVTSEWASLAGAIADDDWWRLSWTIGGSDTPTFAFAVVIGILTDPA